MEPPGEGYGAPMAEGTPNIGDFFTTLTGGTNPFAGVARTFEILKKGATDLVAAAELTRAAMENLNNAATRVNRILDDIEEPIRVSVPQMTRAVRLANTLVDQMVDPIERVGPGINRLADTLSSQAFVTMSNEVSDFLEVLGDLGRRLSPLSQLAESTASMFGIRTLAAALSPGGSSRATSAARTTAPPAPSSTSPRKAAPAEQASAKKSPAKKTTAKRAPAKKTAAKKAPAKKTAAKRAPAKKAPAKKTASKRTPAKKASAKKAPAKAPAKKTAGRPATSG